MNKKGEDRLTKLAKREALDIREMIEYIKTFPPSTFRKAVIGYLKRQLESVNCTGPVISWNMHKEEFELFQKFLLLTLEERKELNEQTEEKKGERNSLPKEKIKGIIPFTAI